MPFNKSSAGTLGFWYQPDTESDRGANKKRVLIVAVNNSSSLNITYSTNTSPSFLAPYLSSYIQTLGYTVDTISDYASMPGDLSVYANIWDISTAVTPWDWGTTFSPYTSYLQNGGAVFVVGENAGAQLTSYFPNFNRNRRVTEWITNDLGGGTVTWNSTWPGSTGSGFRQVSITESIQREFFTGNVTPFVEFNLPGAFSSIGTGTAMVSTGGSGSPAGKNIQLPIPSDPVMVCWKTGSLASATAGCLVAMLDQTAFYSYSPSYDPENPNMWTQGTPQYTVLQNIFYTLNRK